MQAVITKQCSKCGECKILEAFSYLDKPKGRRRPDCKACEKRYRSENRERIAARRKVYEAQPEVKTMAKARDRLRIRDKTKRAEYSRMYYTKNKDIIIARHTEYGRREYVKARKKKPDTEKRRAYIVGYLSRKRQTDPAYRIRKNISRNILHMLQSNGARKAASFLKAISYTMTQLKEHLEKQFAPWMTWDNYGLYEATWDDNNSSTWKWQIDHIIPQSNLPYTSYEDDNFLKCWSLENLRPLSAKQNVSDGARRARHKKFQ